MKFGTLLGIAALGGAYYAHRRRGGELTVDSVKDSLRALRSSVGDTVQKLKRGAPQFDRPMSKKGTQSNVYEADIVTPTGGTPTSVR